MDLHHFVVLRKQEIKMESCILKIDIQLSDQNIFNNKCVAFLELKVQIYFSIF
jgi:hypothetical protein